MIRNSLFITATVLIVVVFALMRRLDFLAASKRALFLHCGMTMAIFFVVLGLNLFARRWPSIAKSCSKRRAGNSRTSTSNASGRVGSVAAVVVERR